MKFPGIWVFFFVLGTTFLVFTFSTSSSIPGMEFSKYDDDAAMFMSMTGTSRKLKGNAYYLSDEKKRKVNLDDYQSTDPIPRATTSVQPGPIEHGTPIIPFIPKPSPPDHPNNGDSN